MRHHPLLTWLPGVEDYINLLNAMDSHFVSTSIFKEVPLKMWPDCRVPRSRIPSFLQWDCYLYQLNQLFSNCITPISFIHWLHKVKYTLVLLLAFNICFFPIQYNPGVKTFRIFYFSLLLKALLLASKLQDWLPTLFLLLASLLSSCNSCQLSHQFFSRSDLSFYLTLELFSFVKSFSFNSPVPHPSTFKKLIYSNYFF